MRFSYTIYPGAVDKLKVAGIEERIQRLKESEDGLPYIGGFISHDMIVASVHDLQKDGFYRFFPEDFQAYKERRRAILQNPESFHWVVERPSGVVKEPCDVEDLTLFTGEIASMVLNPKEIWDYKRFGFSSPTAFVGVVSAYIREKSRLDKSYREGYKWTTLRNDGEEIVNEVTGDTNADLRIFQTDITPYKTLDPFGNQIGLRPEISQDKGIIAGYHSTEPGLLVAVLKYIEQEKIAAGFMNDGARNIVAWGRSFGRRGGKCAEHFDTHVRNPRFFFSGYPDQIPRLDERNSTPEETPHWIPTDSGGEYGTYVSRKGELVFSYQNEEGMKNPVKTISARFLPEDTEELVRGLIFQCAKGLGGTSLEQVLRILEYRFSSRFQEEVVDYFKKR